MVTKSEIKAIITEAVKRQVPLSHARGEMTAQVFYYWRKKYGLAIPKYKLRYICDMCGEPYEISRHGAGGLKGTNHICQKCKPQYDHDWQAKWRKDNPAAQYKKNPRDEAETENENSVDYYRRAVSGWAYNPKSTLEKYHNICQGQCGKWREKLNRFGLCKACYKTGNFGIADPENPYYAGENKRTPVSEWPVVNT